MSPFLVVFIKLPHSKLQKINTLNNNFCLIPFPSDLDGGVPICSTPPLCCHGFNHPKASYGIADDLPESLVPAAAFDRFDDTIITGASAEITLDMLPDLEF